MAVKKEKKKISKKGKVVIITITVVVVLAAIAPTYILLHEANHKGNADRFSIENTPALEQSQLEGKTIIFLGSSVTYGSASRGVSFVEYMEKRDGIVPVKETVGGTTLVDETVRGKASYIARMKTIDPDIKADAFFCQLSTNDATMKKPLGEISASFELQDFDTSTVAGAIEYVIAYARETWDCPIIFYTGTRYKSARYGEMVKLLLAIQEKWDIGVIDLWNDAEMNAVSKADYALYMVNGIHPSQAGYREWWTPKFEAYLAEYLN